MKHEIGSPEKIFVQLEGLYQETGSLPYELAKRLKERARSYSRESLERTLSIVAMCGDFVMISLGFLLAFWLRFYSGWVMPSDTIGTLPSPEDYARLIAFGVVTVFLGLVTKNVYGPSRLRSAQSVALAVASVTGACLFIFAGLVTVLQTNPPISRMFVVYSFFFIFMAIALWRVLLSQIVLHPALAGRLKRRLLIVGWNDDASRIKRQLQDQDSMYRYIGWVGSTGGSSQENQGLPLGTAADAREIIRKYDVDLVVHADRDAPRADILSLAKICELEHVQFKLIPRFFEILVSGLRPGNIGGVPILGVEALPVSKFENRLLKRMVDVAGATIGLVLSVPLMAIFGALVYLESPGPIFYRQVRLGRNGRLFKIIKIRSMHLNAEADGKPRWADSNDSRRLKVGAFIRRWNIDETPQFWNVLKGEMSLVGPRPERPELIEKFKYEIPHYEARHTCSPGITGWAQVHGLRGNTSLHDRIREDIWYVENWSPWLDLKIAVLTFFRFSNAY